MAMKLYVGGLAYSVSGKELNGRSLVVNQARPQEARSFGGHR